MIRILADNDVNGYIITGVFRRKPSLDLIRAVDVNLAAVDDAAVLAWAAAHDRIVLSSDRSTMQTPAEAQIVAGEPMPGLLLIRPSATIRQVIDELIELDECSEHAEWAGVIAWVPLRPPPRP
jgi:hypothetical protein